MLARRPPLRSLRVERRRSRRIAVTLKAGVCSTNVPRRQVAMTNISPGGCRLETPFGWPAGSMLVITIPTLAPRAARVLWRSANAVGLAFDQALNPMVLDGPLSLFRARS